MSIIPDKVDVVIPVKTKESIRNEFIERIREEIPVNKLIIIEGGALSTARKRAYEKVSTEWFVFLDDDVMIGKGWWKTMTSHIDNETGAIGGIIYPVHPHLGRFMEVIWMLRDSGKLGTPGIDNCLMRKECLKDYDPPEIFYGEDEILYKHVTKKWKWKRIRVNGLHYTTIKDMIQRGYTCNKLQLYPKRNVIRRFLLIPLLSFFVGLKSHSLTTAFWIANYYLDFLVGWMKALVN
ncbi:MAG: glycosyltransferase [Candidatus Lokiarchaeia archaeon]